MMDDTCPKLVLLEQKCVFFGITLHCSILTLVLKVYFGSIFYEKHINFTDNHLIIIMIEDQSSTYNYYNLNHK